MPIDRSPDDFRALGYRAIDAIAARLALVQAEGRAFLTGTELDGQFALRACIVNFRTQEHDLDALLDAIADAGQRCG